MTTIQRKWFDFGKRALQKLRPGTDCYVCPLCLIRFEQPGEVTRDHVPPASFGGRYLVLTCCRCNTTAGNGIDSDLAADEKLRKIGRLGGTAARLSFTDENGWMWTEVRIDRLSKRISMVGGKDMTSAKRVSERMRLAREGKETTFKLAFTGGNPRRARLSILRAAYLAAFAKFGYCYILRDVFDEIRFQLANPDTVHMDHFCLETNDDQIPRFRLSCVHAGPVFLQNTLAVRLGRYLVFLPVDDGQHDLYSKLSDAKRNAVGRVEMKMTDWGWPTKPEHIFDFDQSSPTRAALRVRLPHES